MSQAVVHMLSSVILVAIGVSSIFCVGVLIGIVFYWKSAPLIHMNYTRVLFITIISVISCLMTCLFVFPPYLTPSDTVLILQVLYSCQSIIPFHIISQHITVIKLYVVMRMCGAVYAAISFILCVAIVIIDLDPFLFVLFALDLLSECFFISAGFALYYHPSFIHSTDHTVPIVPYIMVRPIIIAYIIPVAWMNVSPFVVTGYISFGVITISWLAILTMVMPLICYRNSPIGKHGYDVPSITQIETFTNNVSKPDHLNTSHIMADGSHRMDDNEAAERMRLMDIIAPPMNDKRKNTTLSPNSMIYIKQSSTILRLSTTANTSNISKHDTLLSIPSLPPEGTGGRSITLDTTDPESPEYTKRQSDESKSVAPKCITRPFSTSTTSANSSSSSSCNNTSTDGSKYSHIYSKDTNKVLGSTLQEISENHEEVP